MNITQSLGEIRKNRSQFKQWELEQRENDAKREALVKKNPPSEAEIKHAKKLGKVIIDVVDVMDQHSEDVAESIETATQIPMILVPFATLIGGIVASAKYVVNPASKEKSKITKEFADNNKQRIKDLIKKIENENPKKRMWLSSYSFFDKNTVEKLKTSSHNKLEAEKILNDYLKATKIQRSKILGGKIAPLAAMISAFVFGNAYATKLQIGGSKVARFQAREQLKDPKYFVSYSPEQIEQAKENLKQNKNSKTKKKKLKSGMFKSIDSVLADNKKYKAWKKSFNPESQKVAGNLSKQELIQAQKDQEIIQRSVKKINNTAEVYSENMEVAANVILGGTPVLGGLIGWGISALLKATNVLPGYIQKLVDKDGSEDAKKAYAELKKIPEGGAGRGRAYRRFTMEMWASDVNKIENRTFSEKMSHFLKQSQAVVLSGKRTRNWTLGIISGVISGVVGAVIGMKLQKASARAGRYTARRELEKDPNNFIGYTQEELDSVQAEPKEKPSKVKEAITFLPRVMKQYYEYNKYKKHELKNEEKLKDELIKVDVTDKQLQDAKNLQRKLFNTFEQVDDKSQTYSESVELVTQTAQPFIYLGGALTAISPLIFMIVQGVRGKLTAQKVTDKLIGLLSKSSKLMKTKLFKKYLGDVSKKVPDVVRNMETSKTSLKKLFNGVELNAMLKDKNLTYGKILNALSKNVGKMSTSEIREAYDTLCEFPQINKFLKDIPREEITKKNLSEILVTLKKSIGNNKVYSKELLKIKDDLKSGQKFVDLKNKIEKMSDKEFEAKRDRLIDGWSSIKFVRNLDASSINRAYMMKTMDKLQKVMQNVPQEEIGKIMDTLVDEFNKNPDEFMALLKRGNILSMFNTKSFQNALKIAGWSWAGFTFAMTFALEAWFADMQLKAGRLGVMKAMEELKDPAFYANEKQNKNLESDFRK